MRSFLPLFLGVVTTFAQPSDTYDAGKQLEAHRPVRAVTDPGVVTTRQSITPAGVPTVFNGRVYAVAFGASASEMWVLNATNVFRLDWRTNKILDRIELGGAPGLQSLQWDPLTGRALASAVLRTSGVQLLGFENGHRMQLASELGTSLSGALAVAPAKSASGERRVILPLTANNKLAILDADSGKALGHAETGIAPFGSVISRDGAIAYVTNWGGRLPTQRDLVAKSGSDNVVVDKRGIASTGTVTRIDLNTRKATHTIPVELHPTAILWDEPRATLYVANGNKDSVSVVDTRSQRVVRTIAIQPFSQNVAGIAPTALAISSEGAKLYVACGGINAIAVVDTASARIDGLIPTAWYPNSLAMSPDGKRLAVSSLLGPGSGWRESPGKRFVHAYRGAVSVIELPDTAQLAGYSTAVAENSHLSLRSAQPLAPPVAHNDVKPRAIPMRSGDPTPIEHVVYIIKENRTYDQVFGDLPQGNGDPSLVMFGRDITPNQHRLAEQFVVLDNFYATGGNSADGHQWVTQANETAYCMWPGYAGRSYPFDGSDPIAYAANGFLWDYALARNKSVRIYGEYAGRMPVAASQRRVLLERWSKGEDFSKEWKTEAPISSLNKIIAQNYPSYTTSIPDVIRAQLFLTDLKQMETEGKMPHLILLQLPSNHTNGASPNVSSAKAMVADNDLALGQIVEGLTKSRFWPKMAIFVVEDDAQNGVDHVDGHRTTALAISPYVRRGSVDSTFYSTQSMVKTIELILGLPTMSLFDLIAHDMRNSFTDTPDLTPYAPEEPKQSLYERNPPIRALQGPARQAALASLRMKFEIPDAAPTEKLNRILWGQVRGWTTPYPGAKSAVFAPLSLDVDDDDR